MEGHAREIRLPRPSPPPLRLRSSCGGWCKKELGRAAGPRPHEPKGSGEPGQERDGGAGAEAGGAVVEGDAVRAGIDGDGAEEAVGEEDGGGAAVGGG